MYRVSLISCFVFTYWIEDTLSQQPCSQLRQCQYCNGWCSGGRCITQIYDWNSGGYIYPNCDCIAQAGSYCNGQSYTSCPMGYFCGSASMTAPTPCPIGYFCGSTGMAAPTPCPVGSYCPVSMLSAPIPCPQGNLCPTSGLSAASPCPAGSKCVPGGSVPVICPAGTFSLTNATECTPCISRMYSTSPGSSMCTICPAGSKCALDGSPPVICPAGTYSPNNATQCTPCGEGATSPPASGFDQCYCIDGWHSASPGI